MERYGKDVDRISPVCSNLILPLVGMVSGIVTAYCGGTALAGAVAVLISLLCYLLILKGTKTVAKALRYSKFHNLWLFGLFFGLGVVTADFSRPLNPDDRLISQFSLMSGRVAQISAKTGGDRIILDVSSLLTDDGSRQEFRNLKAIIYSDAVDAEVGDVLLLPSNLKRIEADSNVFSTAYPEYLAGKGIFFYQQTPGRLIMKCGHINSMHSIASDIRDSITAFIESTPLQKTTRYFLITILTGDRSYLDANSWQLFSHAGIAHILALSGMHIAIVGGIFLFLLFPINFTGRYKFRLIICAILLWGYTFITGMSPSTVRACLMSTIFVISYVSERKGNAFNALLIAATVILIFDPWSLFDTGFQLSFLCVVSLIIFANRLNPFPMRTQPLARNIAGMVLASLVTTFATWIVVAYRFNIFPLMFLPANVLILPALPVYVVISLVYLALTAAGLPSYYLGQIVDYGCRFMNYGIHLLSGRDSAVLELAVPGVSVVFWLAGIVFLALTFHQSRKRLYAAAAVTLILIAVVSIPLIGGKDKDGFIICKSYPKVTFNVKTGFEENIYQPVTEAVTLYKVHKGKLLVVDTDVLPGECDTFSGCDYLVMTGSCKKTLEEINAAFSPRLIVLHPSIRRLREAELLAEADSLDISVHSLRQLGPLRVVNTD